MSLLGLLMVLSTLGALIYETVSGDGGPPDIVVWAEEVVPLDGRYLVRFTAFNQGEETGAQVLVRGELRGAAGELLDRREVHLDYVPARSRQQGGLYFSQDPRQGKLLLYVEGYSAP